MLSCKSIFLFLALTSGSYALLHSITIFSDYDGQGESVTFSTKKPNLTEWYHFLENAKSFCISSLGSEWIMYGDYNYEYLLTGLGFGCRNYSAMMVKSLRFLGPSDTSTEAITLFNGTFSNNYVNGPELIVTNPAAVLPFGMNPTAVLVTGGTNRTLWSEPDFSGNSTCIYSFLNDDYHFEQTVDLHPIQSVMKGCA